MPRWNQRPGHRDLPGENPYIKLETRDLANAAGDLSSELTLIKKRSAAERRDLADRCAYMLMRATSDCMATRNESDRGKDFKT